METVSKKPETRLLIRWLAGVGCLFFFYAAIATAFPKMIGNHGQPSLSVATSLVLCGVLFASIAARGKFRK
jgi:ABC-type transport system involved in cytochrome c biogenesis permease component